MRSLSALSLLCARDVRSSLALILATVLALAASTSGSWLVQRVDAPKYFWRMTDRCLRVDEFGNPHIAYGGEHLYYARRDGACWHHETVDSATRVGSRAALALGPNGWPHISYRDDPNRDLKYAYRDPRGWHSELVDEESEIDAPTSIGVESSGNVHIAYFESHGCTYFKHARRDSTGWDLQAVEVGFPTGWYLSLALASDGFPHLCCYGVDGPSLRYVFQDSVGWHVETVDSAPSVSTGACPSLALDAQGFAHVSYRDGPSNDLRYACRDGAGWHTYTADPYWISGSCTSIAVDTLGQPHIGYGDWDMQYAYRDIHGWHHETVDGAGLYCSLALGPDATPRLAYVDGSTLKLGRRGGHGWETDSVDTRGMVGGYTSLVLDGNGEPHVCYYDYFNHGLKLAALDGDEWDCQAVASSPQYGWAGASLAIDPAGCHRIAAFLDYWMDLIYLSETASGWESEVVDTAGYAGEYPSLGLDAGGSPRISYYGDGDLRFAQRNGPEWSVEIVDAEGWAGHCTSLVVDGAGGIHITYSGNGVRYARNDGSGWLVETVDAECHGPTSLALDVLGQAHVSYQETWPGQPRYAYRTGGSWNIEAVPCGDDVSQHGTLGLDGNGNPHICYYDYVRGDLKCAHRDASGWHVETVDSVGRVGLYTSVAVGIDGCLHVSYFDSTKWDLKYARRDPWGIGDHEGSTSGPWAVSLARIGPNPLRSATTLTYTLDPGADTCERPTQLWVLDCLGRRVASLVDRPVAPGTYSVRWTLDSNGGIRVAPGVYFLRLEADNPPASDVRRIVVVR